jgi:hypothetical protein
MGGGGKGTTQTTQKMEIPPEVMARYNAVNARAETVAQQPFQAYSNNANAFVAPLTPTQQAGIQNTNMMAGAAQPFYQAGAGLTAQGAQDVNPQGLNLNQFYNPYTQSVADTTLRALQQQQGIERSSLVNPQTARSFGGDRSGIVAANLARQQDLATAQSMAPIFQKGFADSLAAAQQQQGVGLAAQQANATRALQAGAQFGQLGTGAQQAGLAGAQAQQAAGQTEQQTQQAGLQALYNQWQQQQAYPFQLTQFLSNIATGTGALSGNTTSGTQSGGGGFFSSDERLKENIQKVGETNDGQNIYRYNYKGDPRTQIGLLAQEVAKDHPEAVGKHDGYLTVNYRDATNDAVRDHKATGGAEGGMAAYDIAAPSAMLSGPKVGLGAMQLPQMIGGGGLAIQPGATNPADQGLLAPKATGYSLGSKEGAQAELASLHGADMSKSQSGQEYFDYKTKALDDFLKNYDNSSQGGLVSGPGAFARGGYAEAGYVNPALAYYGPKGGQAGLMGAGGPYGAALSPAQVQMLKGAELKFRQSPDGIDQANKIANLTSKGNELYQAWKKPAETTNEPKQTPPIASSTGYTKPAQKTEVAPEPKGLVPNPNINVGSNDLFDPEAMRALDASAFGSMGAARGGLIVRQHHGTQGYVNAGAGPYSNSEDENNTLGSTLTSGLEKHEMMQPGKLAQPHQGPSGVQQASQAVGLASAGKKAFDFGSKMLGSLGGEGAAATGAAEAGLGAGAAGAAEGAAGLAGAAGAAEGAGMLGSLGAAAGTIGEGISAILPFLALSDERMKHDVEHVGKLNDGQPVYRFKYNGDDKTRMGLMAQDVEHGHPEAVKGLGGVKMVDYKKATNDAVRQHHADGERVLPDAEKKEDPSFLSSIGDFASSVAGGLGKAATGVGETLKSKDETFWVPAIAGLGSMLASRNPTLLGAVGEGLVGGTGAYTNLQKQNADMLKQRYEMVKNQFVGPVEGADQKLYWRHVPSGKLVPESEYQRLYGEFMAGRSAAPTASYEPPADEKKTNAPAPQDATGIARNVINAPAPQIEQRRQEDGAPAQASAQAAKPPTTETLSSALGTDEKGQPIVDKAQIKNGLLKPELWTGSPPDRNPVLMRQRADVLSGQIDALRKKAERIATTMPENSKEAERLTSQANQLDSNRKELLDRSEGILNEASALIEERNKQLVGAKTTQEIGRTQIPSIEPLKVPEGKTQAQLETDPEFLAQRIKYNEDASTDLKNRGALDAANKYTERAEADRKRLNDLVNIVQTTRAGTQFSYNPNAQPLQVTKPEDMPADYKGSIDPNTGMVNRRDVSSFVGYKDTQGHPVDPELIGQRAILRSEEGDKRVAASIAKSQKLETEMDDAAERSAEGIATLMKFATAAKVLEAKGANTTKAELANLANGLGMEGLAKQVMAEKDVVAAYNAMKTNVDQAISQVTQAFARPTQAEFMISEKKSTPSIDMPADSAYSLTATRLAGLMWQSALKADWEREKIVNGTTNFATWKDAWQRAHPKAMFEEAASRTLGNFKGQDLPKPEKFAEGVVYVMPKDPSKSDIGRKMTQMGYRPGDLFVMRGVDHENKDIGTPTRVSPTEAYKVHLQAPALTYGAR